MIRRLFCPAGACVTFAIVAALVIAGLTWVTIASLNVEAAHGEATVRADRVNKERLALWRLDGQLLPALGLEGNRPFSHFAALNPAYPAVVFAEDGPSFGSVRLPSPLLSADLPDWMLLHFQIDSETGWQSPQVLPLDLADRLRTPPLNLAVTNVTPERQQRLDELRSRFPVEYVLRSLGEQEKTSPELSPFVVPFPLSDETAATKPAGEAIDPTSVERRAAPPTDAQERPARTAGDIGNGYSPGSPEPKSNDVPPLNVPRPLSVPPVTEIGPPPPSVQASAAPNPAPGMANYANNLQAGGRGNARTSNNDPSQNELTLRQELTNKVLNGNRGVYEPQSGFLKSGMNQTEKEKGVRDAANIVRPDPMTEGGYAEPMAKAAKQQTRVADAFDMKLDPAAPLASQMKEIQETAKRAQSEEQLQKNDDRAVELRARVLVNGAKDLKKAAEDLAELAGFAKPAGDAPGTFGARVVEAKPSAAAPKIAPVMAPAMAPAMAATAPPPAPKPTAAPGAGAVGVGGGGGAGVASGPAKPNLAADALATNMRDADKDRKDLGLEELLARAVPQFDGPAGVRKPAPAVRPVAVHLSPLHPIWLKAPDGSEELILVRAARLEHQTVFQGVLLDWPRLQQVLGGQVADLFPDATLTPVHAEVDASPERAMTALPAQLDPGPMPDPAPAGWTPLRMGLILAWVAALVGLAAVGIGGSALVNLSERRIRFVSAVTHELRTPLTSLRLYLDLLTSGLITDEQKQKEYLTTLAGESDRLNRLVENVLDFARLEKRSVKAHLQSTPLSQLLESVQATWTDRCTADGKELVVISTVPAEQRVTVDPRIAEQVLGNLIDNARKYTREATDPRIWVWAKPGERGRIILEVEDRGSGIPVRDRVLVFRAFRRGAEADAQAGGAGLGLALAKQWAEMLDGKLTYRPAEGGVGACFRLELPAEKPVSDTSEA